MLSSVGREHREQEDGGPGRAGPGSALGQGPPLAPAGAHHVLLTAVRGRDGDRLRSELVVKVPRVNLRRHLGLEGWDELREEKPAHSAAQWPPAPLLTQNKEGAQKRRARKGSNA